MFTYDWKTHLDSGLPMLWLFVNSANEHTIIVCRKDYTYEYYRGKDGRLLLERDITAISGLDLHPIVMLIGDSQYFDGVVLDSPGDSLTILGEPWKRVNPADCRISQTSPTEIELTTCA